jgi:hypothetical protein
MAVSAEPIATFGVSKIPPLVACSRLEPAAYDPIIERTMRSFMTVGAMIEIG